MELNKNEIILNNFKEKRKIYFKDQESKKKAIKLLNSGYGYSYLARVFHCTVSSIKSFKYREKKRGVFLENLPKNGGIKPEDCKKVGFLKLFRKEENVNKAIYLLKLGYSYTRIGKVLGCDRTSVIYFHKKKIKEGILKENKPKKCVKKKRNYKSYLKEYKEKTKQREKKRMDQAKKTIAEVRKKRKEMGCVEDIFFYDEWV